MLIPNNKYISVGGVILKSVALPACTTIHDTGRGTSVQNSEIGYLSYLGRSVRLYRDKKTFLIRIIIVLQWYSVNLVLKKFVSNDCNMLL